MSESSSENEPSENDSVGAESSGTPDTWSLIQRNQLQIGPEDLLSPLRVEFSEQPEGDEDRQRLNERWSELVKDFRIRLGTLLKSDSVSILLGAGASKHAGGPLLGRLPLTVERNATEDADEKTVGLLYGATRCVAAGEAEPCPPGDAEEIAARVGQLAGGTATPLPLNVERLLSLLHIWRGGLTDPDDKLEIAGRYPVRATATQLDALIERITRGLASACALPAASAESADPLRAHRHLLKKLLARPLTLRRASIFTLNYDTLVEQAGDAEGLVISDGFTGSLTRVFRPESYDHDYYFPAETTEGRVHRLDRVLHLYKLHGSVTWRSVDSSWENPYGIEAAAAGADLPPQVALIYPTPAKHGESLGMPYAELFRRFAMSIVRPQAMLVVIGYGFGDEHVISIVRQAMTLPSFRLVIVDPAPTNRFVERLQAEGDQRVWVISGSELGVFERFVDELMPELTEEAILRKVIATHRALTPKSTGVESPAEPNDE